MRFLSVLLILVLGFHGVSAFGEEIPAWQPPIPENATPASENVTPAQDNVAPQMEANSAKEGAIDRTHAFFDRKINGLVTWFDGLFGEKDKGPSPMAKNHLMWSNDLRAENGNGIKYRSSLRAHLSLPKFQRKLRLVVMEENREEAVAPIPIDPGTPVVNTPATANTFRAVNSELRYYVHDTKSGYAFLAAGTRFVWPPETFVRARFLRRYTLAGKTFISPSVTPFWQDHIGLGVTPQLDFGHTFGRDHIFLWTNAATVYEKRSGVLWGTEVSLSRILSPRSAIAFAVGASGSTRPSAVADQFRLATNNYRATVKYRRNIYRPWLFLELVPEANWRRDEAAKRELVPAFTARLEINSLGPRALLPVPVIIKEPLPIPGYDYF